MDYLDTKGRIFDVQKYSIHDGPGIRTIVFLKGCVLRCKWCCNPESQEYKIQTMKVQGEDKVIGRDVTVREMIEEVEKDRVYYYRSGGGMTLSGGECLCQPEFAGALLRAAKERGISTAIESMACAKWETIETILPYLDTTGTRITSLVLPESATFLAFSIISSLERPVNSLCFAGFVCLISIK